MKHKNEAVILRNTLLRKNALVQERFKDTYSPPILGVAEFFDDRWVYWPETDRTALVAEHALAIGHILTELERLQPTGPKFNGNEFVYYKK